MVEHEHMVVTPDHRSMTGHDAHGRQNSLPPGSSGTCHLARSGVRSVGDGVADVLINEVGIDRNGCGRSLSGSGDDLRPRIADVSRNPDPGLAGRPIEAGDDPAVLVEVTSELQ